MLFPLSYGFLQEKDMPPGEYREKRLSRDAVTWAVTDEFAGEARNHCAAVCTTNLMIWKMLEKYGLQDIPEKDRRRIFDYVHRRVGNGPVIFLHSRIRKMPEWEQGNFRSARIYRKKEILSALDRGVVCTLLLAGGMLEWHWVLATGYRVYSCGGKERIYLRIADSWHRKDTIFYPLSGTGNRAAFLLAARSYNKITAERN